MAAEEEEMEGAPEWITTFVDMISLLVTFFILLFTFSSLEENDTFQIPKNIMGTRGTVDTDGGPTMVDPPADDVMSAMDAKRGASSPHVRSPDKLPENLEEMGQKLTDEHIEFDPQAAKDGLVIRYDVRSTFRPGSTELTPHLAKALIELGEVMENYSNKIVVEGFTDSEFKPTPNYPTAEALACARATSAARVMVENTGLSPKLVQVAGLGMQKPLNQNATPTERTLNRRIEIRIMPLDEALAKRLEKKAD